MVASRTERASYQLASPARVEARGAAIVGAVAHASGFSVETITGTGRYWPISNARMAAVAIARNDGLTLIEIGAALGGRHHSTVKDALVSVRAVEAAGGERAVHLAAVRAAALAILAGAECPPLPVTFFVARRRAGAMSAPEAQRTNTPEAPSESAPLHISRHGYVNRSGEIICRPWGDD